MYENIYHISDIHIRLFSRIKEYELVFENLYKFLKSEKELKHKNGLIVITGDILHNKIDLTPECILLTYNFLNSLSKIFKVIMIAGNHDALLNNRERIDSLTSILENRCPKNLHYLKNTGYYEFDNIVFGLNSILDDEILIHKEKSKNKILIGLFHGQMKGWINNFGFKNDHGETTVEEWSNFDLVLLGDIHKYQYMNKEKTIAYSGSLISQNYAETNPEHGVLIWNLHDYSSEYYIINNPYAYKILDITDKLLFIDNNIIQLNQLNQFISEYCNLKIKLSNDKIYNNDIINYIKNKFKNVKIQLEFYKTNELIENKSINDNNEAEWIKIFVNEKLNNKVSQEMINKIVENLLLKYKNYLEQNKSNFPSWEIISLKFNNLFGYGTNNEIDFKKLNNNSVTGIFGKNSAGKSTLIDIITFLLYGKITRGNNGNSIPKEIINFNENSSDGELIFKVGNDNYKIHKKISKKNDKIKIIETLFQLQNDEWKNISEEHRKKTDKIIEQLLGTYDSFIFTNFTLQQNTKSFRDLSPKDKKEFLYQILCLNWFEEYKKECDDNLKEIKLKEKLLLESIKDLSPTFLESELNNYQKQSEKLKNELSIINDNILNIENEYDSYLTKSINNEDIQNHDIELKNLNNQLNLIENNLNSLLNQKNELISFIKNNDLYDLENQIKQFKYLIELKKNLGNDELIKEWINESFKKWQSFYSEFNFIINNSEIIMKKWNDLQYKKDQLQLKLQEYKKYNLQLTELNNQLNLLQQNYNTNLNKKNEIINLLKKYNINDLENQMKYYKNILHVKNNLNFNDEFIKQWINESFKKWQSFYSEFNFIMNHSENIIEKWNNLKYKKDELQLKLQDYKINDYFKIEKDFLSFESHKSIFELEIKQLNDTLNNIHFIDINHEFETLFKELEKNYNEYKSIYCELNIYNKNFKDILNITYNEECNDCMNNPFYLRKNEYKYQLNFLENKLKTSQYEIINLIEQCEKYIKINSKTMNEQIQEIDIYIQKNKTNKLNYMTMKEELTKKKEIFEIQLNKYENTIKYNEYKLYKKQFNEIENELMNSEIANHYHKLNIFLKQISIINSLNEYKLLIKDENNIEKRLENIENNILKLKNNEIELQELEKKILEDENKMNEFKIKIKNLELINQEYNNELKLIEKEIINDEISNQYQKLNKFLKYVSIIHSLNDYKILIKDEINIEKKLNKIENKVIEIKNKEKELENKEENIIKLNEKINEIKIKSKELEILNEKYKNNIIQKEKINKYKTKIEKEKKLKEEIIQKNMNIEKENEIIKYKINQIKQVQEKINQMEIEKNYLENTSICIDRDGLPFYILKMYLPKMEENLNQICQTFIKDKNIILKIKEKDIIIGLESNLQITNYLGGMESFILDLGIKFIFSKYAQIPKSNFFMIDEGISVFDQDKITNIQILFNFMTSIIDHILLISHLPTIQDYVDQHINIQKNDLKSKLICNY
jgi:DNA repair exonuclease SbcCD ATPase subunit